MKKLITSYLVLILSIAPFSSYSYAAFSNGYPVEKIEVTPNGPAQMQTIKVEVKGEDVARPKVVWVQSDTDIWTATFDNGTRVETGTHNGGANAEPLKNVQILDWI